MLKIKRKKQKSVVNRFKLVYLPLLIGVATIITVSITSYYIGKYLLLDQMKQDAINLAKLTTRKIQNEMNAINIIEGLIEDKIRIAGNLILNRNEDIDEEFLIKAVSHLNVDIINIYNGDGHLVYSSIENFDTDAEELILVREFIKSDEQELIHDIKAQPGSNLYTYGYIKGDDGRVVQVGILASSIKELTKSFSYQEIVDNIAKEDSIAYALVLNTSLETIADSDLQDIGIVYEDDEDYLRALRGEISVFEWYYEYTDSNVLEVAAPIYKNDEMVGILGIGLSMDNVYTSIYFIFFSSIIITSIMVLLFLWIQKRNIIKPIQELDESIHKIDVINNVGYKLPLPKRDTFYGLFTSVNTILEKINGDFNKLKEQDEYIAHLAYHDYLTNLPNRRLFVEKLEVELKNNCSGAIMLIDIDNFKGINDTLGHLYGDKVIKRVAQILEELKDDNIFISQFGGDEFLILIKNEEDPIIIEGYANSIKKRLCDKLIIEEDELFITISIGITMYPLHSIDVSQLIMNADIALYAVKSQGKNNYMFFNNEMLDKINEKAKIEGILRETIKKNAFKLLYQPQINTNSGEIAGFEALLRIEDYNLEPGKFIPVAEETGLILDIGRWVITEVISQLAQWKEKGMTLKPVSINFSVKQLNDLTYVEFLEQALKDNNIEGKYIEIEITESLFVEKKEMTFMLLNRLKSIGVRISLDDFGTGYSSLSYLTFLPVDIIKLDKSLSDRHLEDKFIKIIEGIISLAHSLNLKVVAEGIEDIEQYKKLRQAECNYIQGYLFSKPIEPDEAERIYNDNFLKKIDFI